jgi:hypothetical protein
VSPTFDEVTRTGKERSLLSPIPAGGRNVHGHITVRHRGGGHKRALPPDRLQAEQDRRAGQGRNDRVRPQPDSRGSRSLNYADGEKRYILAPIGLKRRRPDHVSSVHADIKPGNALKLKYPARYPGPRHRAQARQGGADGALRRDERPADGARGDTWRRSGCPPARCAWSTSTVSRPSARSATPSTRIDASARRVARAGWASVRSSAVSR